MARARSKVDVGWDVTMNTANTRGDQVALAPYRMPCAARLMLGSMLRGCSMLQGLLDAAWADWAHQVVVGAALHHAAAVDDSNLVGVTDRREAVRDRDRRALLLRHDLVQRGLHHLLALVVERTRRLVEQHDRWLAHERAADGDSLLLPTTHLHTAQPDLRGVAVTQVGRDEAVRIRQPRRFLNLLLPRARLA
eukprot:6621785-Prymnesium_polylepis.2